MRQGDIHPVIRQVGIERHQAHETRQKLFDELENELGRTVVSFFTSFRYPVMIEDSDSDMLEGLFQKIDLSKGLALIISSPGGHGLAAERIINVCRTYSDTSDYWAIVAGKAKSAATMVCLGASKIYMGPTSELGPIDPQVTIREDDSTKLFSAYNIVESYKNLFQRAVRAKGRLEPYLQQLQNYDEREISELTAALSLSEDIAIRTLKSGMLKTLSRTEIKKKIAIFLTPKETKMHGRPIYREEAAKCGLKVEPVATKDKLWQLIHELYIRTNTYVSTEVSKCIESSEHMYCTSIKTKER